MVNGLSGERMLIGLAIGIAVLIVLVLKTKIQAFLALIISTVVVGVIGGMPLTNITIEVDGVEKTFGIVNSITSGFGGTLGSIGIIIGFGVMMGQIFEVTGAAKRMAHTFLKLFGKKREEEALALTGFLVSIPIFCDSGFVVLAPIAKAISKATKKSVIGLGTFMAEGLAKTAIPIIILPLLIATAMRFIQGSGTVAMTTAASITAPIIAASGVSPILGAVACCVGSLFFGYFNDSYFWVVNRTLGVSEAKDQLTIWSVTSTVAWAVGVVEVLILNIFM